LIKWGFGFFGTDSRCDEALVFGEIAGAEFDSETCPAHFPIVELDARRFFFAVIDFDADGFALPGCGTEVGGDFVGGFEYGDSIVTSSDWNDDDLDWRKFWGADETLVIAVGHDEGADEPCTDSP